MNKDNKKNHLNNIQLKEFGQTPEQLFFKPHPKKYSKKIVEISIKENNEEEINNGKITNENEKNKENKDSENNIDEEKNFCKYNSQIDEKEKEEKKVGENNKEEKNNIKNYNMYSKPFPIKSNIDLKLIKQYKSAQKFDDIKVVTGTILPKSNLVISGNVDGQLNIYYYYSGEISKHYSLSQEIQNINSIDEKTIIYSSDYSINTFDISIGKNTWSFYAHDKKIYSLFYDEKYKNIISSTKNGIINIWDYKHKSSIPYISHFLFDENNIISTNYNSDNKFFYSLGENGNINILNIFNDEEIYKWNVDINNNIPNSISANLNNLNQFIIGFKNGFKIFDVRNYGCVEDWTDLNFKVDKCIFDSNNILIQNEFGLFLYDYKQKKKIGERILKEKIGFFDFISNENEDTKIVYGDEQGNVFYSMT